MAALKQFFYMILAPWVFALGRLLQSSRVLAFAAQLDPLNSRFQVLSASLSGRTVEVPRRMIQATNLCLATQHYDNLIFELAPKSQSQLFQDVFALLANDGRRNGYFVEVGVGDGTALSNSLLLEQEFGWSGLLVEPNRDSHVKIRTSRKAKLAVEAAYNRSGEKVVFSSRTDLNELSGISVHLDKSRLSEHVEHYEVETATLDELLEKAGAPESIDFLSVDTEGSEFEVLQGLSFNRWQVNVLAVEHNYQAGKVNRLDSLLLPLGYRRVLPMLSQFDAWYVHKRCSLKFLSKQ